MPTIRPSGMSEASTIPPMLIGVPTSTSAVLAMEAPPCVRQGVSGLNSETGYATPNVTTRHATKTTATVLTIARVTAAAIVAVPPAIPATGPQTMCVIVMERAIGTP